MKKANTNLNETKIRINTTVTGEPAEWLSKWKRRDLITSFSDGVVQALRTFKEKVTEQDLKSAQLGNIKRLEDEW